MYIQSWAILDLQWFGGLKESFLTNCVFCQFLVSLCRLFKFMLLRSLCCLPCTPAGALRRWYNPPWFSEQIPSTPYDPLALRKAFEKVCSGLSLYACLVNIFVISNFTE